MRKNFTARCSRMTRSATCDKEPEEFVLQKEEVSEVRWFAFSELMDAVEKNRIPNCIHIDELEMVRKKA